MKLKRDFCFADADKISKVEMVSSDERIYSFVSNTSNVLFDQLTFKYNI